MRTERPPKVQALFINPRRMPMGIESQYLGCTAFLILNGPSVLTLPLHQLIMSGIYAMTVNNGARTVRGNASVMLDPPHRFSMSVWNDPTVQKFCPTWHFAHKLFDNRLMDGQRWQWSGKTVAECPNVTGIRTAVDNRIDDFLTERVVTVGASDDQGGVRSVMQAALKILYALGFRRVFIAGADFCMDPSKPYHYTIGEPNPKAARGNNHSYSVLNKRFAEMRPVFDAAGFMVYNCTPGGGLTAFPRVPFEQAVKMAREEIGDWTREQVNGMYDDEAKKELLTPPMP